MLLSYNDQVNVASSPLKFNVRLTLSDYTAVIKKYNNPQKLLSDFYEGQVMGEIWGYTTAGYFTSADDVKNSAKQDLFRSANLWIPIRMAVLHREQVELAIQETGPSSEILRLVIPMVSC